MRRILIDKGVEARALSLYKNLTDKNANKLGWKSMPLDRLKEFHSHLWKEGFYDQGRYVFAIIIYYDTLLMLEREEMKQVYELIFRQWDYVLNIKLKYKSETKEFYKHVIDCMRYKDIRSSLMRSYMKEQGIKTCVYCNAQYAVTTEEFVEDGEKRTVGTYQFDHFMPESKYPFLCTSYYNLQPSCPTCNGSKEQREAKFYLYTRDKNDMDVFWFELTPDKAVSAYVSEDMEKLEVKLNSPNDELLKNHQALFHIDYIYEQHIDVAQRILVMLRAFSDSYMQSLTDSIAALFPCGVDDPESFFFGYYMKKEHVHLQPLSLMAQSVVKTIRAHG